MLYGAALRSGSGALLAFGESLAADRPVEGSRRKQLDLPPAVDAALHMVEAEQLPAAGRHETVRKRAAAALEELPGNEQLAAWEVGVGADTPTQPDPWAPVIGPRGSYASTQRPVRRRGRPLQLVICRHSVTPCGQH